MSNWPAIRTAISQWKEERAQKPFYANIPSRPWGEVYGHTLHSPYTEEELAESEKLANYAIPHDFRNYLKYISREVVFGCYPVSFVLPSDPFPPCKLESGLDYVVPWELESTEVVDAYRETFNPSAENSDDEGYIHGYEGMFRIGDGGCAVATYIVLSEGSHHGEIWFSDGENLSLEYPSFLSWMKECPRQPSRN